MLFSILVWHRFQNRILQPDAHAVTNNCLILDVEMKLFKTKMWCKLQPPVPPGWIKVFLYSKCWWVGQTALHIENIYSSNRAIQSFQSPGFSNSCSVTLAEYAEAWPCHRSICLQPMIVSFQNTIHLLQLLNIKFSASGTESKCNTSLKFHQTNSKTCCSNCPCLATIMKPGWNEATDFSYWDYKNRSISSPVTIWCQE